MEGFASLASADRYLRLLVAYYRFKRFTDTSKAEHNRTDTSKAEHNRKASLQLAACLSRGGIGCRLSSSPELGTTPDVMLSKDVHACKLKLCTDVHACKLKLCTGIPHIAGSIPPQPVPFSASAIARTPSTAWTPLASRTWTAFHTP